METESSDAVVVGATPGGITAALAAADRGLDVALLERTAHVGGLPANGLGATDIETRGATAGLFQTFVDRIRDHYVEEYGPDSSQATDCSDGYHFEPHVAEGVFEDLLAERDRVTVRRQRQFDSHPGNVEFADGRLAAITVTDRESGAEECHEARVFFDGTYEGDLAAAAGAPYRIGREGQDEYDEPLAGKVYKEWSGPTGPHTTGEADNAIQSYNYRLCLTTDDDNAVPIEKPESYDRSEYVSLIDDIVEGRHTEARGDEYEPMGMQRIVNKVELPNGKTDANNQHAAFISTDLPEENWPWPSASWDWRDRFAERLREYTLGLLWFAQHDPELPESFKEQTREWGLAADEYGDTGNFPRQVYVREGRRVESEHFFTAHDSLPVAEGERPPIYSSSVTASHYALDSHAVRKREPERVHLDGFLSKSTEPYTVPYGVIVPQDVDGLLTPVPVSGTHMGFSTLRMEPCWMALGEAAGVAAAEAVRSGVVVRDVDVAAVQRVLLDRGAVLTYYEDVSPDHPQFAPIQFFGARGYVTDWTARLDDPVDESTASKWASLAGVEDPPPAESATRGEYLAVLYRRTEDDVAVAPAAREAERGPERET